MEFCLNSSFQGCEISADSLKSDIFFKISNFKNCRCI